MTDDDRLRRAYERLVWAYPRWYRRERGAELVTTLLDDARPGQRRPRLAEALNLIRSGLRTRFGVPRHVAAYLVAGIFALWFATVGAAVGVRMSPYPGPPPVADALAVAAVAVPQAPHDVPGPVMHCDLADCPDPVPGDDVVSYDGPPDRTDRVAVSFHPPAARIPAIVADARRRLAAAGWSVSPLVVQSDGFTSFEASNGGLDVYLAGDTNTMIGETRTTPSIDLLVSKGFSRDALVALAEGAATGLLIGWVLTGWVFQRRRAHGGVMRVALDASGLTLVVVAGLMLAETALMTFVSAGGGFTPNDVQIPEFILTAVPHIFPVAGVALGTFAVLPFVLAAMPAGRDLPPGPQRPLAGGG